MSADDHSVGKVPSHKYCAAVPTQIVISNVNLKLTTGLSNSDDDDALIQPYVHKGSPDDYIVAPCSVVVCLSAWVCALDFAFCLVYVQLYCRSEKSSITSERRAFDS